MDALAARVKALARSMPTRRCWPTWTSIARRQEWILRYPEEFYTKAYAANSIAALDKGLARAGELEAGKPGWPKRKGGWCGPTSRRWMGAFNRTG